MAARIAGARFFGIDLDRAKNAAQLAAALGGLKGPLMKVAQFMATIPEALPEEWAEKLQTLRQDYTGRAERYGLNPADVLPGDAAGGSSAIDSWLGLGAGLPAAQLQEADDVDPNQSVALPGIDPNLLEQFLNGK